jgi:hypothetical protein
MATIQLEIEIAASRAFVWDAIRDVGAIHRRLVRGFVVDCRLDGDARVVTFANGMTVRELIVSVDDALCRHAWSARGEPFLHHNASAQVFAAGATGDRCRVVWIADLLPDGAAGAVREMMTQGLQAMKTTLESDAAGR